MIEFANPHFLWLLLIPLGLIFFYIFRRKKYHPAIILSSIQSLKSYKTFRSYFRFILPILRIVAIILIVIALARPQSTNSWESSSVEGIDIILSLDISSSMLAQDFKPDRIEAAKDIASKFISGRPNDRIGLVVFSGQTFTQCPLTSDHAVLLNLFRDIKCGMIEDGTSIGDGLANAVRCIKDSEAISKVVILLTDGMNNAGSIDPTTAAEIAKTFGIRFYCIGVGSMGTAPYPVQTAFGIRYQEVETQIDEPLLQNLAQQTDGRYFRATDNESLEQIYHEIDQLEKSKISVYEHHKRSDEYLQFLIWAAILLVFEIFLRYTYLRQLP